MPDEDRARACSPRYALPHPPVPRRHLLFDRGRADCRVVHVADAAWRLSGAVDALLTTIRARQAPRSPGLASAGFSPVARRSPAAVTRHRSSSFPPRVEDYAPLGGSWLPFTPRAGPRARGTRREWCVESPSTRSLPADALVIRVDRIPRHRNKGDKRLRMRRSLADAL